MATDRLYSSSSLTSLPIVPFPLRMVSAIWAASPAIRAPADAIVFTSSPTSLINSFALSTVSPIDWTACCTSSDSRSIVSFIFFIVSLACCSRFAIRNGSRLGMVDPSGAGGAASLPIPIERNAPPTSPSVSMVAMESVRTSWCRSSVISSFTRNFSLGRFGGTISFTDPPFAPDTRTIAPG